MNAARRLLGAVVGGMLVLLLSACASRWESMFEPAAIGTSAAPLAPLPADSAVHLRQVDWDRLNGTLAELEAERAASDAPPEEWPQEKKDAAKAKLLRALQVTASPAGVVVLGRSAFRTTYQTDPNAGELEKFARSIGADTVVWASSYLGKTQVVRDEPVTEWRTSNYTYRRGGRWHSGTYTENSTIWVPIVVEADEHAFMAYYLRTGDGGSSEGAGQGGTGGQGGN